MKKPQENNEKQQESKKDTSEAEENLQSTDQIQSENQELSPAEQFAELEKQHSELKDAYLRKIADFENYRKRMIKEKQDAFDYANTQILTDLVPFLDDFDRGLLAANEAKEVASVVEGIKMINKQMHGLLDSKYNLACYGEKGDPFDPNIHEAIASAPAEVAEPTCAEVYLKGYKLKERVIRAAKVMVHMPQVKETANDSACNVAD